MKRNKRKSNDTHRLISASINKIAEAINISIQQNITLSSSLKLTQTDACLLIICSRLNYISKHNQSEAIKNVDGILRSLLKNLKINNAVL